MDQKTHQSTAEKLGDLVLTEEENMKYTRDELRDVIDKHIGDLRQALGYQDSVQGRRGVYQLDPKAIWTWDVAALRQSNQIREVFCEEMDSLGINELRREIQTLGMRNSVFN
jgi:hypothetical protein